MDDPESADFYEFVAEREKDLRRIATATRQEHRYPDVVTEAWLMGYELGTQKGLSVEFADPGSPATMGAARSRP